MSKPKAIAVNGAFSLLPPYDRYTSYRIEWYDNSKRRTDGLSTGTADLQTAQEIFYKHYLANTPGAATEEEVKDEPAAQAMSRYYLKHAGLLASAKTALAAMNSANEQFKDKLVSKVDAAEQLAWITALRTRGVADSTIMRWLGVVFAAFQYAVDFKHLSLAKVPARLSKRHWGKRVTPRKHRCGTASRRELTAQELGTLCNAAATSANGLRYFICALGSGGRPFALVNLTSAQYDPAHGVLDLNPIGREQNDKFHPRVAVAPIFGQWLAEWDSRSPTGHYMGYRGEMIAAENFFKKYIYLSGVPDCVPYTLRHTVASWLAGHAVPKWERSQFMGHARPDGNTTDGYSHCDPKYLRHAAAAIQKLFEAVAPYTHVDLMKHVWVDQAPLDTTQGNWVDRFLGADGHRLVGLQKPQAPPPLAFASQVAPPVSPIPDAAPARSEGGQDAINRAFPTPESDLAWYARGTSAEGVEKSPLESMGRARLELATNTLKGPTGTLKDPNNQ